jgi:hypothetical protein
LATVGNHGGAGFNCEQGGRDGGVGASRARYACPPSMVERRQLGPSARDNRGPGRAVTSQAGRRRFDPGRPLHPFP